LPDYADYLGSLNAQTGLYALEQADLFNLLCIPPRTLDEAVADSAGGRTLLQNALAYCEERRAMLLVDPPTGWKKIADVTNRGAGVDSLGLRSQNAVIYFPRVKLPDPKRDFRLEEFPPSGIMAGIYARTDVQRGVWKAPAGIDAVLSGVSQLSYTMTDKENGILNPIGVNCLRTFPVYGNIAWGARTLKGADEMASEWKYVPVRRLALFLEESLYRGTKWVVFEPNDEPLWSQIRLNIGAFMNNLFRQGAFQGSSPAEAYFVKCDKETTTQNDINLGIVNIVVGYAPLKPAEFVIIKFQQIAGKIAA
jgi:phage tail sheath protein FI